MAIKRISVLLAILAAFAVGGIASAQAAPAAGEWTGSVESYSGGVLVVSGLRFQAASAQLDAGVTLTTGQDVEVKFASSGGQFTALKVELRDDDVLGTGELNGTIESTGTDSVTVGGVNFDTAGARVDNDVRLVSGERIEVHFRFDGAMTAYRLDDENDGTPDDSGDNNNGGSNDSSDDRDAFGTISAINGSTITVNGADYDISRARLDDEGTLAVGVRVDIDYVITADGTRLALEIEIEDDRDDDNNDDDDNGCVRPSGWTTYEVRRGDTLSRIAGAAQTTIGALVEANCLSSASIILVGQDLYVPVRVAPPSNSGGNNDDDDRRGDDNDDDDRRDDDDNNDDDDRDGSDDDNDDDDDDGDSDDDDDDDNDDDDNGDDDDDDDDGDDD